MKVGDMEKSFSKLCLQHGARVQLETERETNRGKWSQSDDDVEDET